MAKKLEKGKYPADHGPNDFQAFGPPALNDSDFDNCKIADMGSFSQGEIDTNKYYHAAVVKSRKNGQFYVYFEWGRVGSKSPQFQFVECRDETEAQREFASQCHEKNDKRGVWTTIAGMRTLTAKPGKDVYLVRQLATRSTGLPDAKTIKYVEVSKKIATPIKGSIAKQVDPHTSRLLQDLIGGTIKYTRSSMADNSLPTQVAIDQGRQILTEAQKRVAIIGDNLDTQIGDRDLRMYSSELYRRIPKIKVVGTPDSVWILSSNNILSWQQDLDAFESAIAGQSQAEVDSQQDPFHGLPLHMEWIEPKSELGKFLYSWWPEASANRHGYLGKMNIKNIWKIDRHGDDKLFQHGLEKVSVDKPKIKERPLFQPKERYDLKDSSLMKTYHVTNTGLLFHGTRTCNLSGILRTSFRQPKELTGVAISGALFGEATAYLADDWRKSAGYTSIRGGYWSSGSGGIAGREAFMFAVDAVLGEPFVATGKHGYKGPPKGHHCVFGKGGYSGVQNNEWVVFDKSQLKIRYLIEFSA